MPPRNPARSLDYRADRRRTRAPINIQPLVLRGMMGVDLTAIPTIGPGTALVIASEIGPDFSAFPSAQHFCTWLSLAPGTRISGGKNLPGESPKAVNPVGQALRMAAMAARRSQTFIGAKHRARLARMDTPVGIKATARELACLVYCRTLAGHREVEEFHLLLLDRRNKLLRDELHQRGTVTHTPAYPREICIRCLETRATAILLLHNHPSGSLVPSQADIDMTRRIRDALKPIEVTVHDHVIVTSSDAFSFRDQGLL